MYISVRLPIIKYVFFLLAYNNITIEPTIIIIIIWVTIISRSIVSIVEILKVPILIIIVFMFGFQAD